MFVDLKKKTIPFYLTVNMHVCKNNSYVLIPINLISICS